MSSPATPPLDFVVIGAYKAATTSLHLALRAHPEVYVPAQKEPSWFAFMGLGAEEIAANPISGIAVTEAAAYERLFDGRRSEALMGEVSPEYLKNPRCAEQLHTHLPDAKLVAILRNPAERAHSDYLMYRRDGQDPAATFADAIAEQPDREAAGLAIGQYLATGRYGEQLERYYELFDPEQILVLRQDSLHRDPAATFECLASFLGVDPAGFDHAPADANRSGVPSSLMSRLLYVVRRRAAVARRIVPDQLKQRIDRRLQSTLHRPELDADVRAQLLDYYESDMQLTELLTGLDLSDWRTQ